MISTFSTAVSPALPAATAGTPHATGGAKTSPTPREALSPSISLSQNGRVAARVMAEDPDDSACGADNKPLATDDSHLPESVRMPMRQMRRQQEQLRVKVDELQRTTSDPSINAKQRSLKMQQLDLEISALTEGINAAALKALAATIRTLNLPPDLAERMLANLQ